MLWLFRIFISITLFSFFVSPSFADETIERCFDHRKWSYNENFSLWVEDRTLFRCVQVDGVLKARTGDEGGMSDIILGDNNDGTDLQICRGKKEDDIVINGKIQFTDERDYNGNRWNLHCAALGDVFAKNASNQQSLAIGQRVGTQSPGRITFNPEDLLVKDPNITGFAVRSEDVNITGISKERDLRTLIIGFTNFVLPYVSVLSIFAIVAGGFFYLLSFANDELHTKAKTILTYVMVGIVLILTAVTIVNTLLSAGGGGG